MFWDKKIIFLLFVSIGLFLTYTTLGDTGITATFVSIAPGNSSSGIYKIDLPAISISGIQLYSLGYNGPYYQIDLSNSSEYYAYPINGFELSEGGGGNDTISTLPISTYFIAPIDTSTITGAVSEYVINSSGTPVRLSTSNINFPPASTNNYPNMSGYSIMLYNGSQVPCYNNSTDAIPVLVLIKKNGKPVLPTDPIYNNIVFLSIDPLFQTATVIGCNPFDNNCGDFAVLPSSEAEIYTDSNGIGYVRYGTNIYSQLSQYIGKAKMFYLYCGSESTSSPTITVALIDKNGDYDNSTKSSINLNISSDPSLNCFVSSSPISEPEEISFENSKLKASNIYGPSKILYPDYVANNYGGQQGIYFLAPIGVNNEILADRFNWSNLSSGIEIPPFFQNSSYSNPFIADGFSWYSYYTGKDGNDYYSGTLLGLTGVIYDYLFTQYGNYYTYSNSSSAIKNPRSHGVPYFNQSTGIGIGQDEVFIDDGNMFLLFPYNNSTNFEFRYYFENPNSIKDVYDTYTQYAW